MSKVADRPTIGRTLSHRFRAEGPTNRVERRHDVAFMQSYETPTVRPQRVLEAQFKTLAKWWTDETIMLSNPNSIRKHPAYSAIVAMAPQVMPQVFDRLPHEPTLWMLVLRDTVSDNPIKPWHAGKVQRIIEDWQTWGREHGYLD